MKQIFFALFFLVNFTCATRGFCDEEVPSTICSPTECYTVIKKLGGGALGEVFAVQNSSGEQFALKRYYKQDKQGGGASFFSVLADVEREFNYGQMFHHPNIIKSVELFEEESSARGRTHNLLLELVYGDPVVAIGKKTLSKNNALSAADQLVDVLSYAFSLDYIYLDLHAGNIMLDDSGQIKVVDLASFFSWEEIFAMVNNKEQEKAARSLEPVIDPIRRKKFEQFVANNPELFARIQQCQQKSGGLVAKGIDFEQIKMYYSLIFINRLSDLCIKIIMKSDYKREKKLKLYGRIKNVIWSFEEDIEENKKRPAEFYLDRLHSTLTKAL